jgi:hypothetical protein
MVTGLGPFAEHFRDFRDRYVLIGGAACELTLGAAGAKFRATKDLDIVLCVETSDTAFAEVFWAFIDLGGYEVQERSTGERRLYRFRRPSDTAFPAMLELFSGLPEVLEPREGATLTPIPFDGEVASLSAILLDSVYAAWIRDGRAELQGVSVLAASHLIPLKARAWIDLSARTRAGWPIDSTDIRKHRNDVVRLAMVIDPGARLDVPEEIRADLGAFVRAAEADPIDPKSLGLGGVTTQQIWALLRAVYGLDG